MLTQQEEAVSGMRACRKCRERQRFLVGVSRLNERPLLGEGVGDKRLEICRVLMPRQKNTGIGFDLLQLKSPVSGGKAPAGNASELYARGKYGECTNLLASRLPLLPTRDLQRLAFWRTQGLTFNPQLWRRRSWR